MHDVMRASITANGAQNLAEQIMIGNDEIPQIGLTSKTVRAAGMPADMVAARIEKALSGCDTAMSRACLDHARDIPGSVSRIVLDLMAHGRCDAAAWLTVLPHVEWINLPGEMGGRTVVTRNGDEELGRMAIFDTHVDLGQGVTWLGGGIIDISLSRRTLPTTLTDASIGRPLRDVISHPALDKHPLIVEDYAESDGFAEVIIRHRDMAWDEHRIAMHEMTPDMLHPRLEIR